MEAMQKVKLSEKYEDFKLTELFAFMKYNGGWLIEKVVTEYQQIDTVDTDFHEMTKSVHSKLDSETAKYHFIGRFKDKYDRDVDTYAVKEHDLWKIKLRFENDKVEFEEPPIFKTQTELRAFADNYYKSVCDNYQTVEEIQKDG